MSVAITIDLHPPADPDDLAAFRDNLRDIVINITYSTDTPKIAVELTGEAHNIRKHDAVTVAFAAAVLNRSRQTIYRWLTDGTLDAPAEGLVGLDGVLRIAQEWRGQ